VNRCVVSIKGRARTKNGEEIAISAAKQRNLFYHFSGVILKNDFTCLTLKNLYCARKESAARHLSSHNKAQHETNSSPHLISKSCSLQIDNAAFSAPSQVERASTKEEEGKHGKVEEKLYKFLL
jgi:hypothetical protein